VHAGTFVAKVFIVIKSFSFLLEVCVCVCFVRKPATAPFGVAEFVGNYGTWAIWIEILSLFHVIKRRAKRSCRYLR